VGVAIETVTARNGITLGQNGAPPLAAHGHQKLIIQSCNSSSISNFGQLLTSSTQLLVLELWWTPTENV
jgi:hypothetical protein